MSFPILLIFLQTLCFVSATPRLSGSEIEKTGISDLTKALGTPSPPCCSDAISPIACRRLQANNPTKFLERCRSDADFSMIQCCGTCGMESAAERYAEIFKENENSPHCFDRHGSAFCTKFLKRGDIWGNTQWTCDGQFAALAFRICRKTCNYCRRDIYQPPIGRYLPTPCGKPAELVPK